LVYVYIFYLCATKPHYKYFIIELVQYFFDQKEKLKQKKNKTKKI